ncbi:hypothetical protein ESY86_10960 [Subsaximicrobium wynnwilliamsii]|jgi:hypothetical protein|uniref:Uncharacterized protein n=1 Tax=Subsaximicrobium wynnwilliamsii TaxID=291179 RepID=A0A5C6ZH24_9FLAO|nr:hypothetical protein ESY87_05880 [Subsaximicrobium wynnwilliamsii]TXD89001.1 hypothetical protein ESY86_10960 [Subsaximicrobium wynnwilliamsii]TXE03753.1 hypothetical protein ESY88_05875 [Subsaximicrobium wynnwilliamsii]
MDSQNKLINNIRLTTLEIHKEYPELVNDMTEVSKTFLSDTKNGTNNKELKAYLDSLNGIIKTYKEEH